MMRSVRPVADALFLGIIDECGRNIEQRKPVADGGELLADGGHVFEGILELDKEPSGLQGPVTTLEQLGFGAGIQVGKRDAAEDIICGFIRNVSRQTEHIFVMMRGTAVFT